LGNTAIACILALREDYVKVSLKSETIREIKNKRVSETWLHKGAQDNELFNDNYKVHRYERRGKVKVAEFLSQVNKG
jgi:hypothetical protein